jgi:hypothetical protein
MLTLQESALNSKGLETIRQRADALGSHPQATEAIAGLAHVIGKTCERIPYDPDASFAAMLFFDRLERLAKREHFEPVRRYHLTPSIAALYASEMRLPVGER